MSGNNEEVRKKVVRKKHYTKLQKSKKKHPEKNSFITNAVTLLVILALGYGVINLILFLLEVVL